MTATSASATATAVISTPAANKEVNELLDTFTDTNKSRFEITGVLTDCSQGIIFSANDKNNPILAMMEDLPPVATHTTNANSVDLDYFSNTTTAAVTAAGAGGAASAAATVSMPAQTAFKEVVVKQIVKDLVIKGNVNKFGKEIYENIATEFRVLQYIAYLQLKYAELLQKQKKQSKKQNRKQKQSANTTTADNTNANTQRISDASAESDSKSTEFEITAKNSSNNNNNNSNSSLSMMVKQSAFENIMQYITHWDDKNFYYLVSEKYNGGDLFKLMKNMHEIVPKKSDKIKFKQLYLKHKQQQALEVRKAQTNIGFTASMPESKVSSSSSAATATTTTKTTNNTETETEAETETGAVSNAVEEASDIVMPSKSVAVTVSEKKLVFSCMHLYRQSSFYELEQRPLLNHEKTEWIEKIQILFKQMCLAINFLHLNGICHLDISLENFLISYKDSSPDESDNNTNNNTNTNTNASANAKASKSPSSQKYSSYNSYSDRYDGRLKSLKSNLDILTMAKSLSKQRSISSANYVLVLQDIHEMQLKLIDFGVSQIYLGDQTLVDQRIARYQQLVTSAEAREEEERGGGGGAHQSVSMSVTASLSPSPETNSISEDTTTDESADAEAEAEAAAENEIVLQPLIDNNESPFVFRDHRKVGTLIYMAPEVYAMGSTSTSASTSASTEENKESEENNSGGGRAKPSYDPRLADIYSLGICLFLMLTGIRPYDRPLASDVSFEYIMRGNVRKLLINLKMIRLLTEDALDILTRILCYAHERITMSEILEHPFLNAMKTQDMIIEEEEAQT